MAIKQLSIFVDNKPGKLIDIVKSISDAGINIRAMSIADTQDFGILRLIVSDNERLMKILGEKSIVKTTEVLAVKMEDKAGALYNVVKVLSDAGINIEYVYAFTAHSELGEYVVFRVDDVRSAEKELNDKGFVTLNSEDMAQM